MSYQIKKVGVIGAGVMGAAIAAHLANAGIPSLLLDIVPTKLNDDEERAGLALSDKRVRDRFAAQGVQRALQASPAAFYSPRAAALISTGNVEDDFKRLAECDWIIEVIIEKLEPKRQFYSRLATVRRPGTIVTSNTSGISINAMIQGQADEFRRHFFGTHFFNPVRYMKLMEIIPGADTDPAVVSFMTDFMENTLGKGVVIARDTPNFIANRLGVYGIATTFKRMLEQKLTVEEVDAVLGRASARPKSAALRTSDLSGLDICAHVSQNVYENDPNDEEHEVFDLPPLVKQMLAKNMLGDKTGQGFYKKIKNAEGQSEILALDLETLEYRPMKEPDDPGLAAAERRSTPEKRVETLVFGEGRLNKFGWDVLADTLLYSANRLPEIADSIVTIDRAMRWGYNWDLGPFETWDALGLLKVAGKMKQEGRKLPKWLDELINYGEDAFYITKNGVQKYWDPKTRKYLPVPENDSRVSAASLRAKGKGKAIKENEGASFFDMGDGVALLEFHTKINAIDANILEMMLWSLDEVEKNWKGLVVGNDGGDFSAGANLFEVLMLANGGQWSEIERATKMLQDANMKMKYSKVPVVVAPAGRCLGGGCEIPLHGTHVRAAAETYIGLVEVGAGVIPGGGGCKELLVRNIQRLGHKGPFPPVQATFETIAMARVSTSAEEGRFLGFLGKNDKTTLLRENLLRDAKADVLAAVEAGYKVPEAPTFRLPGEGGRLALEGAVQGMRQMGQISKHDQIIVNWLAYIITGGDAPSSHLFTEEDILALERQAFVELCKLPKTQERMQNLLMKGKPLRN